MKRVTGIGGIFFQAKDPVSLRAWYQKHLEIPVQDWGGAVFNWAEDPDAEKNGMTIWSVNPCDAAQQTSTPSGFTINYRVADLDALVAVLRAEGCQVLPEVVESEFGKFAWVIDPEGNKLELWQPPANT